MSQEKISPESMQNQQELQVQQATLQSAISAMQNNNPVLAEKICSEYLLTKPSSMPHMQIIAHSLIRRNLFSEAMEKIDLALKLAPDFAPLHEDKGSVFALQRQFSQAIACLDKAIQLNPNLANAHKKRAQAFSALGKQESADLAYEEYLSRDHQAMEVAKGAEHWRAGRLEDAQRQLKGILKDTPDNVDALRFLALTYFDQGNNISDAEALLRRAIQIKPDFVQGLYTLGSILLEQKKWSDAADIYIKLSQLKPKEEMAWVGLGNAQSHVGDCDSAIFAYKKALQIKPEAPGVHMAYAHMLKTVGRHNEALAAYRMAILQKPDLGEVYWSMANLKTFKFKESEVEEMKAQLKKTTLSDQSRVHFNFSLGKAYEDDKDYDGAWHFYHQGNQLQRTLVEYDPVDFELHLQAIKEVFSADFINKHKVSGNMAEDPIFIVGLPRSGSTLIEQILASHSQVEGTSELHNIGSIAYATAKYRHDGKTYPQTMKELLKRDWRGYGKEYLDQVAHHRVSNTPFFIDKMPNNFSHIGLIKLILPNAKIINTRRHPIDSSLGAYKQLFASGQSFSYDMLELADYYNNYIDIMQHWHEVFPGEILDVHYEETVTNLEQQVRRILDYCKLPFEQSCINFHKTNRHVKTASSEQVRQPIYKSALGLSQKYEKHLDLWHEELASVISTLPERVVEAVK